MCWPPKPSWLLRSKTILKDTVHGFFSLYLSWYNSEKKGLWPCKLYLNAFWKDNKDVCLEVEGLASCLYCLRVAPE